MPTLLPRVYLTLSEKDAARLDRLAERWGVTRPAALRKAFRMAANKVLKD